MMKQKFIFIGTFIFFTIILFLSPISGDDWGNYLVGMTGLRHSLGNAVGMYFDWEGRFISRILINILTYHKVIWNFVNSFVITGIIYLIVKIINKKNKTLPIILSIFVILLMNIYTFSQTIPWIAGNITYLFVIFLLLLYYYLLFNNKINIYVCSFLNLIIPMFIEHMAIILVFSNILFIIYNYIKTKKIDKKLILYLIISIISTTTMLLSPGTAKRSGMENIEFSKLSIISKVIYNIPNFINYTFIINPYLLFLLTWSSYYLIKNNIKNKKKYLLYIYMLPVTLLTIPLYLLSNFKPIDIIILDSRNIFLQIYYIIYILIFIYLIYKNTKKVFSKEMFFFIIGLFSNIVMMASPTWGFRTSLSTYIFLSISSLMIICQNLNKSKLLNIVSLIILVITSLFYFIFYISINLQYKENKKIIEKAIKNRDKVIELERYPSFANCNINPDNDYHLKRFRKYYGISKNVEIKLIDNNWKYLIFYR